MAGRGSAPGERRGGRKKGTPNKTTAEIKALAQEQGPAAIKKLVALLDSDDERTRLAAIKELLDRGYGRPAQTIGGDLDKPVEMVVRHLRLNGRDS